MDINQNNISPLTPAVFHILLAINVRELHGYEIMKQVKEDTNNRIKMGPGTLYGSIKRMLASKLIEEVSSTDDERRRYYKLTERGKSILSEEINRYNQIIETIKSKKLIGLKLNPFS